MAAGGLREARAEFELRYFQELLEKNKWRVRLVAMEAGLERTACYHRLVALGLVVPRRRPAKAGLPKLRLVTAVEAQPQEGLPPTELVKRTSHFTGVMRRIRAKLPEIKPMSDESFEIEVANRSTAHVAARALGMKVVTEQGLGKFIRIWRIT
jgi:hypothetical protein